MAILVLQHAAHVGPGRLGAIFRDHGLDLDIRRLDAGRGLPRGLDQHQGLVSLGGPQNVGENHGWMADEIELIRLAHRRELPLIGICLGSQLIAHALGGVVAPMAARGAMPEEGFHRISINPIGQTDTIFSGIAWESEQYCSHAYEVTQLPADATLLASSKNCRVQAFKAGLRTYGFQYHPECDRVMIEEFGRRGRAELAAIGIGESDMRAQLDRHYASFARLADRLCLNLARNLFPLSRRLSA